MSSAVASPNKSNSSMSNCETTSEESQVEISWDKFMLGGELGSDYRSSEDEDYAPKKSTLSFSSDSELWSDETNDSLPLSQEESESSHSIHSSDSWTTESNSESESCENQGENKPIITQQSSPLPKVSTESTENDKMQEGEDSVTDKNDGETPKKRGRPRKVPPKENV